MAGRVWMKGGANAAWITGAVDPSGPGQEVRSRRRETPQVERREAHVPVTRHAAPQGAKFDLAPFGAPLRHVEGGSKKAGARAPLNNPGALAHAREPIPNSHCLAARLPSHLAG